MYTNKKDIGIYISTAVENNEYVQQQKAIINEYLKLLGGVSPEITITEYVDSGHLGSALTRPALSRLREDVSNNKIDLVVMTDVTRLSRQPDELLLLLTEFDEQSVVVESCKMSTLTTSNIDTCSIAFQEQISIAICAFEKCKFQNKLTDHNQNEA